MKIKIRVGTAVDIKFFDTKRRLRQFLPWKPKNINIWHEKAILFFCYNEAMNFPVDLPLPFLQKSQELNVFPQDIEEYFVRGTGPGGQKINKTASTVLVRHLPTGIEVRCQKHREQSKNRQSAYQLLILKIEEKIRGQQSERARKIFKLIKQKRHRSKKAKHKMLEAKKRRSEIKGNRRNVYPGD